VNVIWVDSNEYAERKNFIDELQKRTFVTVCPLPIDYILEGENVKFAVERKTPNDLVSSISDKRLWDQCLVLKQMKEEKGLEPRLLLEGGWWGVLKFRKWSPSAVMMALESVLRSYDIKIIVSPAPHWTMAWMLGVVSGTTKKEAEYPLRGWKPKEMSINERIQYTLEGVVGTVTAKSLLRRFRKLREIANASPEQLMEVDGVGEKRAKLIWDVFNTEWSEGGDGHSEGG
jgi:DNA excision repair protein ERCC-4